MLVVVVTGGGDTPCVLSPGSVLTIPAASIVGHSSIFPSFRIWGCSAGEEFVSSGS